jgi:NAD(P)H-quinone oxidoreductase subunit 4L
VSLAGLPFSPVGLPHFLFFGTALFGLGLWGVITSRHAIRVLMSIELMLNAVNINLVAFNHFTTPASVNGQVFALFVMAVAAAEAGVALAIILNLYANFKDVDMSQINRMKW